MRWLGNRFAAFPQALDVQLDGFTDERANFFLRLGDRDAAGQVRNKGAVTRLALSITTAYLIAPPRYQPAW